MDFNFETYLCAFSFYREDEIEDIQKVMFLLTSTKGAMQINFW